MAGTDLTRTAYRTRHASCKASAILNALDPAAPPMKQILLMLIKLYQLCLSPYFGGQCRFYPSCSAYASEAIDTHGTLYGSWLALRRLSRCHPWHEGGIDPVPPAR